MQIFNLKKALDLVDNDKNLLALLIDSFLNENKFERSELDSLINQKEFEEAAGYVHAAKGAARQLCLENLQTSSQKLEDALRGKTQGDIAALEDNMADDYREAVNILKLSRPA